MSLAKLPITTVKMVEEFHQIFNLTIGEDWNKLIPTNGSDNMKLHVISMMLHATQHIARDWAERSKNPVHFLRLHLSIEELVEQINAIKDQNSVELLDALIDRQYVLDGDFVTYGMGDIKQDAFEEVHSSNMTKLTAEGKVLKDNTGKILKSDLFRPPNLEQFFT